MKFRYVVPPPSTLGISAKVPAAMLLPGILIFIAAAVCASRRDLVSHDFESKILDPITIGALLSIVCSLILIEINALFVIVESKSRRRRRRRLNDLARHPDIARRCPHRLIERALWHRFGRSTGLPRALAQISPPAAYCIRPSRFQPFPMLTAQEAFEPINALADEPAMSSLLQSSSIEFDMRDVALCVKPTADDLCRKMKGDMGRGRKDVPTRVAQLGVWFALVFFVLLGQCWVPLRLRLALIGVLGFAAVLLQVIPPRQRWFLVPGAIVGVFEPLWSQRRRLAIIRSGETPLFFSRDRGIWFLHKGRIIRAPLFDACAYAAFAAISADVRHPANEEINHPFLSASEPDSPRNSPDS